MDILKELKEVFVKPETKRRAIALLHDFPDLAEADANYDKWKEEMIAKSKEMHQAFWEKTTQRMIEKGLIPEGTDPDMILSDGVIYVKEPVDQNTPS